MLYRAVQGAEWVKGWYRPDEYTKKRIIVSVQPAISVCEPGAMRIGSPQEKSRCESRKRSSRRSCTHSEKEGGSRVRAQLSR